MKKSHLLFLLLLLSCSNNDFQDNKNGNEKKYHIKQDYYFQPELKYSNRVNSIPSFIYDSLFTPNSITDEYDTENLSFSDSKISSIEYDKLLYFILTNDSLWILCYKQGGIGVHNVVDILHREDSLIKHDRMTTLTEVRDTNKLKIFLDSINYRNKIILNRLELSY
jgi:hypothetical protein